MKNNFFYKIIIIAIIVSFLCQNVYAIQIINRSAWEADESYQSKDFHTIKINQNKLSEEEINNQIEKVMTYFDLLKQKSLKDIMIERKNGILKDISEIAFYKIMLKIFPEIEEYEKIIEYADNMWLWWPRVYSKKIKKIIIHHTAESTEKDINGDGTIDDIDRKMAFDKDRNGIVDIQDFKSIVRSIYKYHAITKDWGDIGYNYLIDPLGNIYEGRAGGDKVIGGHVYYANTETIGIAIIGNYEYQTLSENAKKSLIDLIAYLAIKFDIDLKEKSTFRNTYSYNILGHRDLGLTNCPGKNIYNLLDEIRIKSEEKKQEMLKNNSIIASRNESLNTNKINIEIKEKNISKINEQRYKVNISIKNNSSFNIGKKTDNKIYIAPADEETKCFYEPSTWILKNRITQTKENIVHNIGNFVFDINTKDCENNTLNLVIKDFKTDKIILDNIKINIDNNKKINQSNNKNINTNEDIDGIDISKIKYSNIRVKINFSSTHADILTNTNYDIYDENNKKIAENIRFIHLKKENNKIIGEFFDKKINSSIVRFVPSTNSTNPIVTIQNMKKLSSTNKNINYNKFRNIIELRIEDDKIIAINELYIDDYMKGIAETISTDPYEKRKAIAMAAKNYALYYTNGKKKFINKPYDLDSDPNISQYYLGYVFEEYNKEWAKIIEETSKLVITYKNKLIKTPYFSSNNGYTKSAYEVWGWTNTPYLKAKEDPYCKGNIASGHGVGMSGCGSKGMALNGKKFDEILKYYYDGIEIIKID